AASLADLPSALLEGQAQIKKHLDQKPEDPAWLHAQGRAALLLWDFDSAIRSFQMAADLGADSAEFLVDFATAYFERAEQNRVALDYAMALEKLGQALQKSPNYPPALFNRAIIHSKLYQYDPAIADFEEYIRRERDEQWRKEASQRLSELRNRRARVFDPSHNAPAEMAAELGLETAMTGALLDYESNHSSELEAEAAALLAKHQDPWLLETMQLPAVGKVGGAIRTLSQMATLRTISNLNYGNLADEVAGLKHTDLPLPLRIWRDYEILYHETRTLAVANCPDTAELRRAALRYPWFEAQILLESSLCNAGREDFSGAASLIEEARQIAEVHHFSGTLIRVPNFRGQRLVDTGFNREALQVAVDALG